jgi:hypothetical protein
MLTLAEISTLAERMLRKNGYLDPIFLFEGIKDYQTREFPNLPEKELLASLEALGFSFAFTDQIGDLVQIFFFCQAWFSKNAEIRAGDDPGRIDGVFLYQRNIPSGKWDVAEYKILKDTDGKQIELKPFESIDEDTVYNDVSIGDPVDHFLRGFRRGIATRKIGT